MARVKVRIGDLKKYIRESAIMILTEDDANIIKSGDKKEKGEDSIDAQIDRVFSNYENEAKSAKVEGKDWRRTVRRLLEDNENDKDDKKVVSSETETKLSSDDIDIESFTNSVMRLVDNYDSLLEMRNTILRRAANYLNKSYANDVIELFKESLRSNHGIEIGKTREEVADEQFPAPAAERAGGTGGGASA